jgi:hypothetical protein
MSKCVLAVKRGEVEFGHGCTMRIEWVSGWMDLCADRLGLTLNFGIMNTIQFAHGEIYM